MRGQGQVLGSRAPWGHYCPDLQGGGGMAGERVSRVRVRVGVQGQGQGEQGRVRVRT